MAKKKKEELTTQAHLLVNGEMYSSPVYPVNTWAELCAAMDATTKWFEQIKKHPKPKGM